MTSSDRPNAQAESYASGVVSGKWVSHPKLADGYLLQELSRPRDPLHHRDYRPRAHSPPPPPPLSRLETLALLGRQPLHGSGSLGGMALFRKLFYRKPPDGLLEITERVYVFDSCFTIDVFDDDKYQHYIGDIASHLRGHFAEANFMVFDFREGGTQSKLANILSRYDMIVMDYPRQYVGCPILSIEMIHHFLRSGDSWLSSHNVLILHCERGDWAVLAFMLAGLLLYRKQFVDVQKTLEMIYKQAPRELIQLLSPLNPMPSQIRYLQYISRRNVSADWPPTDRVLTLDCVMLRSIPEFNGEGGCRPIFRIHGQDPLLGTSSNPIVLFTTPKRSKHVRLYKQAECELIKIDIHCHIEGDVVLECISLDADQEKEEMMFRIMFNTAFIRSNILMLNRDEIDVLWDTKDRFPREFRAEVLLSEMDTAYHLDPMEIIGIGDKEGLPVEAFAKAQEIFSTVDWLDPKGDATVQLFQRLNSSEHIQTRQGLWSPRKKSTFSSSKKEYGNDRNKSNNSQNLEVYVNKQERKGIHQLDLLGQARTHVGKKDTLPPLPRQTSLPVLAVSDSVMMSEAIDLSEPSLQHSGLLSFPCSSPPHEKCTFELVGTTNHHESSKTISTESILTSSVPHAQPLQTSPPTSSSFGIHRLNQDHMPSIPSAPRPLPTPPRYSTITSPSPHLPQSSAPAIPFWPCLSLPTPSGSKSPPCKPPTPPPTPPLASTSSRFPPPAAPTISVWPCLSHSSRPSTPPPTPQLPRTSCAIRPAAPPLPTSLPYTLSIVQSPIPAPAPPLLPTIASTSSFVRKAAPAPPLASTSSVIRPVAPPPPPPPLPTYTSYFVRPSSSPPPPPPLPPLASTSSLIQLAASTPPLASVSPVVQHVSPSPPSSLAQTAAPPPPSSLAFTSSISRSPALPPSPTLDSTSSLVRLAAAFLLYASSSIVQSSTLSPPPLPPLTFTSSSIQLAAPPPSLSSICLDVQPVASPQPPPLASTSSNVRHTAPRPPPPPPPLSFLPSLVKLAAPPPSLASTSCVVRPAAPLLPPSHAYTSSVVQSLTTPLPTPPPPPPPSYRVLSCPPLVSTSSHVKLVAPPPPPPPLQLFASTSYHVRHAKPFLPCPPTSLAIKSSIPPPPPPLPLYQSSKHTANDTNKLLPSPPAPPPPPVPSFLRNGKNQGGGCKGVSGNIAPPPAPPGDNAKLFSTKGQGPIPPVGPVSKNLQFGSATPTRSKLKPLHWVKVTRVVQGSLWAEGTKVDEASKAPVFDMSELEKLFAVPKYARRSDKSGGHTPVKKVEKVHLIDLRRANNCGIMLTKVKMPRPDLMNAILRLDDTVLDVDQVDNLIKFTPTKEEIDLLKGYKGDKQALGDCEQFFMEIMKVPRVDSKLTVFSFKIQFCSQVFDLKHNLNIVNSSAQEITGSMKLKRIMQTILSLGNALNQGTARGSAVGFGLDSLLKLSDTRSYNNKITLMHYLSKVLSEKLPELLDFSKELPSLELAAKIQLKSLAEEMQALNKGLEKVEEELTICENDGPVSENFRKRLKDFLGGAEAEVRPLTSLYSNVCRNADALALYFGEDPARCPFEQVVTTLRNFVRLFTRSHEDNCKLLDLEKKKAQKEAEILDLEQKKAQKEAETLDLEETKAHKEEKKLDLKRKLAEKEAGTLNLKKNKVHREVEIAKSGLGNEKAQLRLRNSATELDISPQSPKQTANTKR